MPLTYPASARTPKTIELTVNSKPVTAHVEPRLQLAEFLREHLSLTGTHLGCEHGVCGACTIEIDGAPARSCIVYAAACNGADVRTIEGYDDDPREVHTIPEVRRFYAAFHEAWPYWLYFCNLDTESLQMMVMCCLPTLEVVKVEGRSKVAVLYDRVELLKFISGNCLNSCRQKALSN